jgi:outer membrane protein assembly factor BamB
MVGNVLLAAGLALAANGDDWPFFRHDPQNTARSAAVGGMRTAPAVLCRYELGGTPSGQPRLADVDGDGVQEIVTTSGGPVAAYRATGEVVWRNLLPCGEPSILGVCDLDGDGSPEVVASSGPPAAIHVLRGRDGRLLWERRFDEQVYFQNGTRLADLDGDGRPDLFLMGNAPAENSRRVGWAFAFPPGWQEPRLLWGPLELRFNPHYRPQTIVADIDGDGRPEVVVASAGHVSGRHLCVSAFDAATGVLKREVSFPNGDRNYGHLQAIRSGPKPQLDLLVVGMLGSPHITFLSHSEQDLREAWHIKETCQIPYNPVADVDGDGALEVAYTRIDDSGRPPTAQDAVLVVRDLLSGTVKRELPGLRLRGIVDLDGDGRLSLVATTVPGEDIVLFAGTPRQQSLALPGARLCLTAPEPPAGMMNEVLPNRGGYTVVTRDLDGDGKPELLARTQEGLCGISPTTLQTRLACGGQGADVFSVLGWGHLLRGAPEALLGLSSGGFVVVPPDGPCLPPIRVPALTPRPTVAARFRPGGPVAVFATRADGTVVALDGVALAKGQARALWSCPRLGAFDAPAVADLDGDGTREVILCDVATAEPVIVDAEGAVRRRLTALPTDGTPLVTGTCAVGRFGPDGRVLIGALSNAGPNDGTARWTMLDPTDGRVVWQREGGPHERRSSTVCDVDGDGCDDLVHSHFFDLIALNGKTGETLWFRGGSVPGYHLASVADLDGSGKPSVLLSGGYMAMYRFDLQGQELWRTPPLNYNAGSAAALGAGEFGTAFSDRFACYAAADGRLKWSLALRGQGSDVAAADVDGDGRIEFLFGCSDGCLYAVGSAVDGTEGRVLWRVDLGAPVGPPSVADVDGDGYAEVLVATADGCLQVLGVPGPGPGRP